MPTAILVGLVLMVATAFGAARLRSKTGNNGEGEQDIITMTDISELTEEQVEVLLDRLERVEPPEPVMGAMCYAVASIPVTAEYICPECGEKTIYTDNNTEFIEWSLQDCRRLFDGIDSMTSIHIYLDESGYCEHCSPLGEVDPQLYLVVELEDGSSHRNSVSRHELNILSSFFSGRLYYSTWNDGQEPLQSSAGRIRELLGMTD